MSTRSKGQQFSSGPINPKISGIDDGFALCPVYVIRYSESQDRHEIIPQFTNEWFQISGKWSKKSAPIRDFMTKPSDRVTLSSLPCPRTSTPSSLSTSAPAKSSSMSATETQWRGRRHCKEIHLKLLLNLRIERLFYLDRKPNICNRWRPNRRSSRHSMFSLLTLSKVAGFRAAKKCLWLEMRLKQKTQSRISSDHAVSSLSIWAPSDQLGKSKTFQFRDSPIGSLLLSSPRSSFSSSGSSDSQSK